MYFLNVYFIGNQAKQRNGGAIVTSGGIIAINNCTFSRNAALQGGGGALYCLSVNDLTVTLSNFINNSARSGGALDTSAGINLHIQTSHFSGNLANEHNGGVFQFWSNIAYITHCIFVDNTAHETGGVMSGEATNLSIASSIFKSYLAKTGAVLVINSSSVMSFHNSEYTDNEAYEIGGALILKGNTIGLYNCTFTKNLVLPHGFGGAINIIFSSSLMIYYTKFMGNEAKLGGALNIDNTSKTILLKCLFSYNIAMNNGGAISISSDESEVHITRSDFLKNSAARGGALAFDMVILQTYNTQNDVRNPVGTHYDMEKDTPNFYLPCTYVNSTGCYPFVLPCNSLNASNSSVILYSSFINNRVRSKKGKGGAIAIQGHYKTNVHKSFEHKDTKYVGAIVTNCNFEENFAGTGGAFYSNYSKIYMKDITIWKNYAQFNGGGMALDLSTISLSGYLNFSNNEVTSKEGKGGAIYIDDRSEDCRVNSCSISWTDESMLSFVDNIAVVAPVLYGGMMDRCGNLPGSSPVLALKNVTVSNRMNFISSPTITSQAIQFCYCSDNYINCDLKEVKKSISPGQTFQVTIVCVDQLEQPMHCIVKSEYNLTEFELGQGEYSSTIDKCENLTFHTLSTKTGFVELKMQSDIFCTDSFWSTLKIDVNVENCPLGFQLEGKKCQCDKRLQSSFTNIDCCINNNSIILKNMGWFSYEDGLIRIHTNCPLNYCSKKKYYFSPLNPDIQCGSNHGGILCGRCVANYSAVLGSWKCMKCSNLSRYNFIWLAVVMALAGVVLVVILLLVKMTVSSGTMNGLIFYANILSFSGLLDYHACSIHPTLHLFLSWINLDFGIEVCFYSGMDVYQKTWLQYLFPFYIWFLVGVIILFCHYSSAVMKLMGMRNIEVLATLFLLSYAKLLKTIVTSLSFTDIMVASADNVSEPLIATRVWVFDGNLNYLSGKHLPLFIVALFFLLFLFLPYTVLLTIGHYLKSLPDIRGIKFFHNTFFTTILDAYHAPYNKKHRYWTGLGLLTRCVLFTIFATSYSIQTNIFWIIIAVVLLFCARLCIGIQVYQKKAVDTLEILFLLNLMILMLVLYREVSCEVLTASISLSFAMFGFIVICHIQHEVRKQQFFIKLLKPKMNLLSKRFQSSAVPKLVDSEKPQGPSTSYVELRETLLDQ